MTRSVSSIARASVGALATATALSAPLAPANAGGFYAPEQSAKGVGRAFSGEAADTGAAQLWWNPAAIARGERELFLNTTYRDFDIDFEDDGSTITRPIPPAGLTTPVGGRANVSGSSDEILPTGAFAMPVGDRLAFGVSVTKPYHLEHDFGADAWTRYDTVNNLIDVTSIEGVAALRLTEWLDLGVGINAQYIDASLMAAYPNLSPLAPDAMSNLEVDGWNYGFTVGGQAHLDKVSLGVSYRSATEHGMKGRIALSGLESPMDGFNFQSAAETVFTTPWIAIVGVRWRVLPDLTVNAQVQRFGWSEYKDIRVSFNGGGETILQNFEDVTTVAAGLDYDVSPRLTVRGGVQHDPTPSPNTLREPGVADADRWIYGAGATVHLRPRLKVDAGVGYSKYDESEILEDAVFYGGSPAATTARIRGKFRGDATTASIGVRFAF